MHVASDEMIIADDRLSIVLRPTMLLIDFKIKVANIANQNIKEIWILDSFGSDFIFPIYKQEKQNGRS